MIRRFERYRGVAIVLLLLLSFNARADDAPIFPAEIAALGRRFEELAAKEATARKTGDETLWTALLDELLALDGASGNDLAALTSTQVVQVRRAVQARLAHFPSGVLRQYRRRVASQARKWLEEGQSARDARVLQRVVDEAFCSESAGSALELLGDLAFERGEFEGADSWWRLFNDHHPDARSPAIEARQLLTRWFAGDRSEGWTTDLAAFRKRHPKAEGHLAGAKEVYWKRLTEIAQRERDTPPLSARDWTTFAGAATRNRLLPADALTPDSLNRLVRDGVHLTLPLVSEKAPGERPPREVKTPSDFARSLAFCPLVTGNKVLFADARFVRAFDVKTGKREVWCDAVKLTDGVAPELDLPVPLDLRYTLTAAEDCVLARLGVQGLRSDRKERERNREGASVLVCLDLVPDAEGNRVRWRVLLEGAKNNAAFEGTPLTGNGQVYVAVSRFESNQTTTAIHCYALTGRGTPALKWKRDVCSTPELPAGEVRYRHHLLTLAGGQLFYCTHSGAVVALDAVTGRQSWGMRYRQVHPEDATRSVGPRDLNPCVFADGRLYVAPADSDLLLALDPWTGGVIWEHERIEVQHLLGVGKGRVLFTTRTPSPGLRAINSGDGSDRGGWFRTGTGAPIHSLGRGLLAGGLIVWPTLHHVYLVRQEDGEQPDDVTLASGLPSGNFALGDGILAIAEREELHIFAPPRFRLQERKKEAEERPRSARDQFHLGTALADAGQPERTVECFRKAALLAGSERLGGRPLRELAWIAEQHALFAAAERESKVGRREQAVTLVDCATGHYFPPFLRAQALQRAALFWLRVGEPARAVAACQAMLDDKGQTETARRWAIHWLERLEREGGSDTLALLNRALPALEKEASDIPALLAPKSRTRLPELARRLEEAKRPGAATEALRLFLRQPLDDDDARAKALANLARLYEQQGNLDDARAVLDRLARMAIVREVFPQRVPWGIPELGDGRSVFAWVMRERDKPGLQPRPPALSLPLLRSWARSLAPGERLLFPEGAASLTLIDRVFSVRGKMLICQDASTGAAVWQRELALSPCWIGLHADTVIAAGAEGVACLTRSEGQLLWNHASRALAGFQLVAGRLFFRERNRRLVALDGETGFELWTRRAAASFLRWPDVPGRITSTFEAEEDIVLLPDRGEILDARSGSVLQPLPRQQERSITLIDPATGVQRWSRELTSASTLGGQPPQRIALGPDSILLIVPRNHGTTIERIDGGRWLWSTLLRSSPPSHAAISRDSGALYLAHEGELTAYSLTEGRRLWTRSLNGPPGHWRTARAGDWLLAWPIERQRLAVPVPMTWGRLECLLTWNAEESVPVLLCDARTGQLVQRLNLPGRTLNLSIRALGMGVEDELLALARTPTGLLIRTGDGVVHLAEMAKK